MTKKEDIIIDTKEANEDFETMIFSDCNKCPKPKQKKYPAQRKQN